MADDEIIPSYDELARGLQIASDWWGGQDVSLEDLGRRIGESLAALEDERAALSARVLALEQLYDALACHTHCACRREPGDCCAIGSVIGRWDTRYTEQWKELEAIQAERDALRAALLATRCGDVDGPCWCICDDDDDEHGAACLEARAALGVLPQSIRGLDPDATPEPAP